MQLIEIQQRLYEAIFQKNTDTLDFIESSYPIQRLDIYRKTIFANMTHALSITFPGIWILLGESCANNLAYDFSMSHPPTTGCLDDWGEQFPAFLAQCATLKDLPYLHDYALYEWLKHKANGAIRVPAIKPSTLAATQEEHRDFLGFKFIPSCFTLTTDFPIRAIEEIVKNPDAESINLNKQTAYAIIARPAEEVVTLWLSIDFWHFLQYMIQGDNLSQAMSKMQIQHPDFELTTALYFLLQENLIHQIIF